MDNKHNTNRGSDSAMLKAAAEAAAGAHYIAVMTGAGVSAESGIPTFREAQTGLWAKYDPVMLASYEGFMQDPENVWRWYDMRRQKVREARPNPGHNAFASWEQEWRRRGRTFQLVTQNIDDLHGLAGSSDVIELHGNIWMVRSVDTPHSKAFRLDDCPLSEIPPRGKDEELLRPHVVWFGEMLDEKNLIEAFRAAAECDVMIVAGTSSLVYPAAAIPIMAKREGAIVIEVNPEDTSLSAEADYSLRGTSGELLPAMYEHAKSVAD